MRRAAMAVVGVAVAVLLVSGGYWFGARSGDALDGVDPADVRRCIDWTTAAPTPLEIYGGCGEPGDVLVGFAVTECVDDRELYTSDIGWGFVGEPMTAERVSDDVRAQCDAFADATRE